MRTWNIQFTCIVDTERSVAIASTRKNGQRGDRKVDLVVGKLRTYNVKVAGLQETKWFGCDVYEVMGSVVLTSGRSMPARQR